MKTIGIIDSGVGGLALLKKLYYSTPSNFVYFADTENFPYGNKSKKQLQYICEKNLLYLVENHNIDTLIIACNTANLASAEYLQKLFPEVTIIGCEPPLKQALQYTISTPLLVATPFTIDAIKKKPNNGGVQFCALPNLAQMVENGTPHREILPYIESHLNKFENFDCIALGCTHYSHIKMCFEQLFPALKVFDSIDGIYSRIKKLYRRQKSPRESTLIFHFSQNPNENLPKYQKTLDDLFKFF